MAYTKKSDIVAADTVENTAPAKTKKFIVKTPVPNFCGIGAGGVQFAYGQAEVHEGSVLEWYRSHGYEVTEA